MVLTKHAYYYLLNVHWMISIWPVDFKKNNCEQTALKIKFSDNKWKYFIWKQTMYETGRSRVLADFVFFKISIHYRNGINLTCSPRKKSPSLQGCNQNFFELDFTGEHFYAQRKKGTPTLPRFSIMRRLEKNTDVLNNVFC